jgi:membrane carboxypeptidase/penicillin-binding protein
MTRRTPGSSASTPDVVAGLYVGFDKSTHRSGVARQRAAALAAPVAKDFMQLAAMAGTQAVQVRGAGRHEA